MTPTFKTTTSENTATESFNPQDLCSRKLWELITTEPTQSVGKAELRAAISELEARRHYLSELQEIGILDHPSQG